MVRRKEKNNVNEEAEHIVITAAAAKIIANEIREKENNFDCYPTKEDFANIEVSKKWAP